MYMHTLGKHVLKHNPKTARLSASSNKQIYLEVLGHPVPEHIEHPHGGRCAEDRLALAVEVLVTTRLAVLGGTGAVVAHDALRVVLGIGRTRSGGERRRGGRRARPGNMDSEMMTIPR